MLDNVILIERGSKAWGLGQNVKICFPPARGAYFSIKSGQTPVLDWWLRKGSASWEVGGGGLRFFAFFAFFLNFNFISIFIDLRPHFGWFWLPNGLPKPTQNPSNMPLKSKFQKTCNFSSIFARILMPVARANIKKTCAHAVFC